MTKPKYILSVDGGGIRGVIPAVITAEIEKRTKKPISKMFDMVSGTSTGGIVAAGLCMKDKQGQPQFAAGDILELYRKYGSHIFKYSYFRQAKSWFNCSRYSQDNFEGVINQYFGEAIIKDSLTKLLIPCYDVLNNAPFFFKSWGKDTNYVKLKDVLRATTAAPTFFPPHALRINEQNRVLVDGGVFANNPATCAYADAKRLFPNDEIVILSIGTGRKTDCSLDQRTSEKLGRVYWLEPLLHLMFASELDAVNYQLQQILRDKYIRIQTRLTIASFKMDDAGVKNMKCLEQEAEKMINDGNKQLDMICNSIT